jgi:cytochrome P450
MSEVADERSACPVLGGETPFLKSSLADPAILARPNGFYRALRLGDPVHYDEKLGMYLVSRYEDLQTVFHDAITFSQEKGWHQQFARGYFEEFKQILVREGGGYFPEAILRDPPRHARVRRLLEKAFTARRIKLLEPNIRNVIGELIERVADRGYADGVKDFAMPMTIAIMCEQLGISHYDGEKVERWSRAYTAQVGALQDRAAMLENAQQVCELQNYIIARVRERQAKRTEDMISDLIYAQLDDEENPVLAFDEIVALARALLVGGNDTTATALSNLLLLIAQRPTLAKQLEECVNDDVKLGQFVEELLRIEPPVRGLFRVTTKQVELGGKLLPEGAYVCMLFASGNDDEKLFECPREFDKDRKNLRRHVSFGGGVHFCVARELARMEIKVAAKEFVARLEGFKLAVPAEDIRYLPTIAMLSMENLPLNFTRRHPAQAPV